MKIITLNAIFCKPGVLQPVILLAAVLILSACDTTPKTETENPLAGQAKALEKAKDLERQILEEAEQKRKAIDEMTK